LLQRSVRPPHLPAFPSYVVSLCMPSTVVSRDSISASLGLSTASPAAHRRAAAHLRRTPPGFGCRLTSPSPRLTASTLLTHPPCRPPARRWRLRLFAYALRSVKRGKRFYLWWADGLSGLFILACKWGGPTCVGNKEAERGRKVSLPGGRPSTIIRLGSCRPS
jgi:hypothetical protein